ncbi:hypothetical protein ACVNIS_18010 [Sphaerotilaceae bacterium SBD11-9]
MQKRSKPPNNRAFKLVRGRRRRDVIRIRLRSGVVGYIATAIPAKALKILVQTLTRKLAKRRRLSRTQGRSSVLR